MFLGDLASIGELEIGEFAPLGSLEQVTRATKEGKIRVTKDKLKSIQQMIVRGSKEPKVVALARKIQVDAKKRDIKKQIANTPNENRKKLLMKMVRNGDYHAFKHKDKKYEIKNVWIWQKKKMSYYNDPLGQEVINEAKHQVKHFTEDWLSGDCDEFAVLAGSLLRAIGIPVRIVLWRKPNGDWQHIFVIAYDSKSQKWYAVDATEKTKPFGFVAPYGHFKVIRFPDDNLSKSHLEGFFKSVGKFFKKVGSGVKAVAKKVGDVAKRAAGPAAMALAAAIPGVGPLVAPIAGTLVNGLVNGGKANKAQAQMEQAIASGKDPQKLLSSLVNNKALAPIKGAFVGQIKNLIPQLTQISKQSQNREVAAQQSAQVFAQRMPVVASQAAAQNPQVQRAYPGIQPQQFYPYYQRQMPVYQSPMSQQYYQQQRQPQFIDPYQLYPQSSQPMYPQPMYADFAELGLCDFGDDSDDVANGMLLRLSNN